MKLGALDIDADIIVLQIVRMTIAITLMEAALTDATLDTMANDVQMVIIYDIKTII